MEHLSEKRVVLPGYRYMQDTVSRALAYERKRLAGVLAQRLTPEDITDLLSLLEDTWQLHKITQLRREPKDYSYGQIKEELRRREQIEPLYHLATKILPYLNLSNESIKYYGSLVAYYSVYKLKRLSQQDVRLYLLCFVYHRFQRSNDNLIGSLIYYVRQYSDAAKMAAKERMYRCQKESGENLKKAGRVLGLFTDENIEDKTPFYTVKEKAFSILEREKLATTARYITTGTAFDETAFQWEHIDTIAHKSKKRLRPLLLAIDFAAANPSNLLMKAVIFLKTAFTKGISLGRYSPDQFPMRCIPKNIRRYLHIKTAAGKKLLMLDRYEFVMYRLLRDGLEAGNIFCRNSVRYRSFEDDLLDDAAWKNKEQLIADTELSILRQPIREHLSELRERLERRISKVNLRITSGKNKHFQMTRHGRQFRWTLQYPRESDPVNHVLFDYMPQTDIVRVFYFVQKKCEFMKEFEHVLERYTKQDADERLITACLTAWGTNMGLGKMAAISDVGYQTLASASDNFLRLETLKAANDCISNATAKLSIFRHYDIGEVVHSSSDGQKFETQLHTLRARHSPKYFGLKKGITSYTMIANHVPINASFFGANEHESHYVFDLLYNNITDIHPEIHSTDTHGANQVNFALLHIFGYQFAPRYKDIYDTVSRSLYGFRHPSQYADIRLKPIRKINEDLISEEWENIQRIIVSLACKATTQSIVIAKLSAHARKNKTKRALWEYDNIIRSLYLLDYVDSSPLRRNIQKAVNRTESYHKLRRAISYANGGKLRYKTETEQEIWNESSRLIANCIIHYNASILSDMLKNYEDIEDRENAERIKQVSPVAWQHINLYGRYEFQKNPDPINLNEIIRQLMENPKHQQPPFCEEP
jgi:TnpA family transposase